ncbi:MAG TPA: hypothetical protein VMW16_06270 [Sedimentisphaerales bacterium]|nr:hypothetical protein [Sedimentisphaerales bacterium]
MANQASRTNGKAESFEKTLFKAGDKLRKNIYAGFKNNDELKRNTSLHKEAAKIEFKVI